MPIYNVEAMLGISNIQYFVCLELELISFIKIQ